MPSGSRFSPSCDFGKVTLEIASTRDTDAGVYVCRASNALGDACSSGTLNIVADDDAVASSTLHPAGMQGLQNVQVSSDAALSDSPSKRVVVVYIRT